MPVPGPSGISLLIVSSSSPGGILQAQPPPCAYWVSRTARSVTRPNVVPAWHAAAHRTRAAIARAQSSASVCVVSNPCRLQRAELRPDDDRTVPDELDPRGRRLQQAHPAWAWPTAAG